MGNKMGTEHETINCNNLVWSSVDTCVELTCADPRSTDNMSPTLNPEHTCKHLDRIDFNADGNSTLINELKGTVDEVKYGDNVKTPERLIYGDPTNNDAMYFIKKDDGNVKEGSVQSFTCKPGFKPYLNFPAAVQADNYGPAKVNHFDCKCEAGKWICSHSCKCES